MTATTSDAHKSGAPTTSRPVERRTVRIGDMVVGGTRLPVLAGPERGADIVHLSLRRHHGKVAAAEVLAAARETMAGPLAVEPFSAADLPAIAQYAEAVVVGGDWMQDFRLVAAVGRLGMPVVVQRGHYSTVEEWLSSAEYVRAEGNDNVVLCESGSRTHLGGRTSLDLALVREVRDRSGLPVVVDVSGTPWLAGAAIACGADGVWLAEDADPQQVTQALEATTTLTPVVRQVNPHSLAGCREAIDRVDATLASLLDYRATLATEVQRHKPVGGHAGRDPQREAQIVHAMAHRAPRLGRERLARIMSSVIETGLDLAEEEMPADPPVWRL